MTAPVYAYKRGPSMYAKGKRTNDDPELQLQRRLVRMLDAALPADHPFTASAAGVRVGMQTAVKMKGAGVRRGWPDIQILFPSAVTRYIEVKVPPRRPSDLTAEQQAFRNRCEATGRDIWACCYSEEEVWAVLVQWRVPVKCTFERALMAASRYGG